jgi:hypothetical protein
LDRNSGPPRPQKNINAQLPLAPTPEARRGLSSLRVVDPRRNFSMKITDRPRPSHCNVSSREAAPRTTRGFLAKVITGLVLAGSLTWSGQARAEITLIETKDWTASVDGRINAFVSYAYGKNKPLDTGALTPTPGSGLEHAKDNDNTIEATRIRSGFVGSVLGVNLKRQVTKDVSIRGRLAIWWLIEQRRSIGAGKNELDGREAYLKIEGPWGGFMGGRTLALFSRGNIEIDAMYGHGNGVGHPCDLNQFGPTCGHVGFGVQYPGFTPSLRYNTPKLGGFQVEAGIFDPTTLEGRFQRTPLPRFEGEATFDINTEESTFGAHVFASGLWQRLSEGNTATMPRTLKAADAWGVAYGLRVHAGPAKLGLASHFGSGLGISYPVENTQYPADEQLNLRKADGYYAQLMLSLASTDIALGAGISRIKRSSYDESGGSTGTPANLIKSQRGISVGVYQHWDKVVFGIDYFRADYTWYANNKQPLNFISAGATLHY